MFIFRITPGSPTPIYQQITTQLRHAIANGGVEPGELVPSVRALAEQLLINPNTVAKAYAELSKDGLLDAVPGKGLAVSGQQPGAGLTKAERLRRLDPILAQLFNEAVALNLSPDEVYELLQKKWKAAMSMAAKD